MRHPPRIAALLSVLALAGCGPHDPRAGAPHSVGLAGPSDTLYLVDVAPGHLTTVDVSTGATRTRKVAELSPGDPPYSVAIAGGRLVLYGGDQTSTIGLDLREPARSLGDSWFFLPSAAPGRVWLALLDPRSPDTVRALRGVREVTVTGRVTLARSARPPRWPSAALDTGLVLQTVGGLELWDPATGRILRALPGLFPVAARGSRLVSCGRGCPILFVTDTRTGARTQIAPGRGFDFEETYGGAFSPDGSQLAVPAIARGGTRRVALVDVRARAATLIPGPSLGVDDQITWSPTGWLYFYAGAGRLAAYRPGRPSARLLTTRVAPFTKMVAT
ncbi:MAG TPA: hypothetical protein VG165_01460 [Solirubrobacteraceae bacterium]|jgi:hypothetical protein|nr:hypothetical protein [Solirubrobacteraceae bacterium]